jgi:hypothetical protein
MQRDNLQTGIWLIGIGVLALTNFWWPGIMFIIGLSALASGSIQGAVWLFGIGIIALFDFWWPGMLFLVGISFITDAVLPDRKKEPLPDDDEFEETSSEVPTSSSEFPEETPEAYTPHSLPPTSPSTSRSWLPTRCPACGAPLTSTEAIWHTHDQAECPYCHSQLSPKK